MKIIQKGYLPTEKVNEECHKCKTKFEYDKNDVYIDSIAGDFVLCPFCNLVIASKI